MAKKNSLGRGLGALIESSEDQEKFEKAGSISEIDIYKIEVNPFQPRSNFDEESLNELASSIKEIGIIQPITVREVDGNKYQLITGERRYRAAIKAGLNIIPAYIRTADDQGMLEMALVENIQREDLDSIEVAISYQRLIEECKITQESLSDRVGKKRSTIANYLRLLKLPAEIQLGLREKKLGMGHARALISIDDPDNQLNIYQQVVDNDLSVRKTEELVRKIGQSSGNQPSTTSEQIEIPKEYEELQNHLASFFESKVEFKRNTKGAGKIVIPFKSDEELEKIIAILDKVNA